MPFIRVFLVSSFALRSCLAVVATCQLKSGRLPSMFRGGMRSGPADLSDFKDEIALAISCSVGGQCSYEGVEFSGW